MWLWLIVVLITACLLTVRIVDWLGASRLRDEASCAANNQPTICKTSPREPLQELPESPAATPIPRPVSSMATGTFEALQQVRSAATIPVDVPSRLRGLVSGAERSEG